MIPDSHRDLLDAPVGVLGTIGPSGRPQLSAVWFLADGETLRMSLTTTRQKTRNLRANPACSLLIPATPPYRYLEIRGDAELAPDDDYAFADLLCAKYGGVNLRELDKAGESRVVVTLRPARVTTWGGPPEDGQPDNGG